MSRQFNADGFLAPGITDEEIEACDPGIRNVVALFNRQLKIGTTDSGDGVTKFAAGREFAEALGFPHVATIVYPPSCAVHAGDVLAEKLRALGFVLECASPEGQNPDPRAVVVEVNYNPADEVAVLVVMGLNDERLQAVLEAGSE